MCGCSKKISSKNPILSKIRVQGRFREGPGAVQGREKYSQLVGCAYIRE